MALTNPGFVQPIKPWVFGLATNGVPIPTKAAQAWLPGDLVCIDTGTGLAEVAIAAAPGSVAAQAVIGVCLEQKAAIAAPTLSDTIMVAPCVPGAIFEGSMVAGVATDYTYASGDLLNTLIYHFDICTAAAPLRAMPVLTTAGAINTGIPLTARIMAKVIAISPNQSGGQSATTASIKNPRVLFSFINTPFNVYTV